MQSAMSLRSPADALEMWGGVEASVVRIRDTWRDQIRETGHHERVLEDIGRIAALGIRTLRTPVLWERCEPAQPDAPGWGWHDRLMAALREHGIEAIVGLTHHGSGPQGTDLLQAGFAPGLAEHARAAARRYPFVKLWTPVNEPLTTARCSGMYGYWYPHRKDAGAFLHAVADQCHAVLLSMRAIRETIPGAALVQTEDFGWSFATPGLQQQADAENDARWLSLDLLCGRVRAGHPWRARMEASGVPGDVLDALATGEATPDLIGVNHYVTSDRFIDHRVERYPDHPRLGGAGAHYIDIEAARVDLVPGLTGWLPRLRQVWKRYGLPMAITEAHLTCDDPEERVRWLLEAWDAAQTMRAEGADVRAVTAWALFGMVDWDTMLQHRRDHYEPGAFDARHDPPAPVELLTAAIAALAKDGRFSHPLRDTPGWWRRPDRFV